MTESRLFSGDELRELLDELGDRIQRRGESVDAYIIGGTAMAIGLGSRRATEDIDGLFRPFEVVKEEASAMAGEHGLPDGWINQSAFSFISFESEDTDARVIEIGGMHVRLASPPFLLAMKMAAGRLKDHDDIVTLIRHLGITRPEEIADLTFEVFGEDGVTLTDSRESVLLQAEEMIRLAR
ncbi:DUF6036 family nucleotidyltransferase [Herbiconiux sp. P16]|uniref:DUF6036 family nucleotidyltransferase n=1 Tax=Herbiconiux wuyangfengii TaxID=3342794 RepID=UPI0035B82F82